MRLALTGLVFGALVFFLGGCGESGPPAPGAADETAAETPGSDRPRLTPEEEQQLLEQLRALGGRADAGPTGIGFHAGKGARDTDAGPPAAEETDLSRGIPGGGLWCGTGRPGAWQPGGVTDWAGPDAQGLYVKWRAPRRTRIVLPGGPTVGGVPQEAEARYGMGVGSVFHESEPGESREEFLARMRALKASDKSDAAK